MNPQITPNKTPPSGAGATVATGLYDYIIAGGGMAGLSLAYYLTHSELKDKKILIIDREPKTLNDRTWCFWENEENPFEDILLRKWKTVEFASTDGQLRQLDIGDYRYKMLRGIDFYRYVNRILEQNPNVEFLYEGIESIEDSDKKAIVKTISHSFTGDYVFDSITRKPLPTLTIVSRPEVKGFSKSANDIFEGRHNLLQHFKGVVIETKTPKFNPEVPVMMNFGIKQQDETRFVYVLPINERKALIEYTLFSENFLSEEEYNSELENYIKNTLQITDYQTVEDEFGVIPMSDEKTVEFPSKHVVRIGTAGGYTNPSTGYTFANTQRRLREIVKKLEKTGKPQIKTSWFAKRHLLYASILLNVLIKKRHSAADAFDKLYLRNPPALIFKFLDGKTNFIEELKIMSSTPIPKFLAAAIDVIFLRR
jgi:lycopene beta-cyclase